MDLKRFNDLTAQDICFDFQMHTNQTDGSASPEEMMAVAAKRGLKAIAFTEHVREDSVWFDGFKHRIDSLKGGSPQVLLGIEAKVKDFSGSLDASPRMIEQSDLVLGVVHRYADGEGGFLSLDQMGRLGKDKASDTEFELTMALLNNRNVDVLGHPFAVFAKLYRLFPVTHMREVIEEANRMDVAVEINTKHDLGDGLFDLLRELNPKVSIGSDAHAPEEIGRSFDRLKEIIHLGRASVTPVQGARRRPLSCRLPDSIH